MKRLVIVILFAFLILHPVEAAEKTMIPPMIRVSPVILNVALSPGKTYTYEVAVDNLLEIPLPLRTSVENFESTDDDGGLNQNSTQPPSPFLSWIKTDQQEMILPAKSQRVITVTVKIPNKVPFGGYYAVLFLSPVLPSQAAYANIVQSKIGVILLANIGVPNYTQDKGTITQFSFDKNFVEKGPLTMNLQVKNNSLYHFSAKPFVFIQPWNQPTQRLEIGEKIILPGKIRKWTVPLTLPSYNAIVYKITTKVSTGGGRYIEDSTYIYAFPVIKTLIITSVLIILLVLLRKRKKIKTAVRELTKS